MSGKTLAGIVTLGVIALGTVGAASGIEEIIIGLTGNSLTGKKLNKVEKTERIISGVGDTISNALLFLSLAEQNKARNSQSTKSESENTEKKDNKGILESGNEEERETYSTFRELMSPEEAQRYDEYWRKNAPSVNTPYSKIKFYKEHDGVIEESIVGYDYAGRQKYRVDYTDHGRFDHSNPHLHEYFYGPGYDSIKGMEIRYDFK